MEALSSLCANIVWGDISGFLFYSPILVLLYIQVRNDDPREKFIVQFIIGFTFFIMLVYLYGMFTDQPDYKPLRWVLNSISLILYLIGIALLIRKPPQTPNLHLLRKINSTLQLKQIRQYSNILSNKIFESIFKNSTLGVVMANSDGIIIIANDFVKELLMYPDDEIINLNFTQITYEDDVSKDMNLFTSLKKGEIEQYEIDKRYIKKNGDICWVNLIVTKASDNDYMAIVRDISSQINSNQQLELQAEALKRSDEQLKATKEILLKSQENAKLGNWELDLVNNKIILSKPVLAIYGLPEDTVLPIYAGISYYRKDFRPILEQAFSDLIVNEKKYDLEAVLVSESGSEKWIRVIGYPIKKNGVIVAVRGLMMDIDEKKKAQLQIAQKSMEAITFKRKMLLAQSVLGFGVWSYDIEKDFMELDDGIYSLLGLDKFLNKPESWKERVDVSDRKVLYEIIDRLKEKTGKSESMMNVTNRFGEVRRVKNKVESFADKSGKVYLIIGTCTDITEEVQMLSALRKSEQTINEAQQIAGFGYFNYDIVNDQLDWSNYMNTIFEPDQSFGFNFESFLGLIHPEDRDESAKTIMYSMQTGEPISITNRIVTRSGHVKTVHHEAKAFINEEGLPIKIIGSTRDITVQSRLQNQLEENLYHQQLLTKIAILLNNPFDFGTKIKKAIEILGNALKLDRIFIFENSQKDKPYHLEWTMNPGDTFTGDESEFEGVLLQNEILSAIANNKLLLIERATQKNIALERFMNIRNAQILCVSKFVYDDKTEVFFILEKLKDHQPFDHSEINLIETAALIIRNIFKENASSIKLQNSEYKFKTLAKSISDPYIVLDHQYNFIYMNPAVSRFSPEINSFIGKNITECEIGPITKGLIKNLKDIPQEKGYQLIQEFEEQYLELTMYSGKIGYSIIIKDITERINLQNSLETSKKSYENLYNQTPAMMHSIDASGKIISVSEFWLEKMGYTKEEVLNKMSTDFLTEESKKVVSVNFNKLKRTGYLKNTSLQFQKKSGKVMDVLLSATTERNPDGSFLRSLAVITDITAEKAAEEQIKLMNQNLDKTVKARTKKLKELSDELYRQRDFLNTFIQNTDSLIQIKDISGNYLLVNIKFAQLHNTSNPEDLIGKPFTSVYNKEDAKRITKIHQKIIDDGEQIRVQEEFTINNSVQTFLTTRFPLRRDSGEIYAVAAISVDITKIKEQQEKLIEQSEELSISNKILSDQRNRLKEQQKKLMVANEELESFSYSVSHDLRAPLRALEAFSRLLNEKYGDLLDEKGQKWLGFINENSLKMDQLINDILEFSRISRFEIKKQTVNMDALVKHIIEEEKNNYPNHKFDIRVENLADAYGDPKTLKQVWVNLIGNAFKYSTKKEVISIKITSRVLTQQLIYEISDRGSGFNEDYATKIFNVFQRLHNEKEFTGTGVGLAIVKKIIDKHDGGIIASGEIDQGATFTFSLPRKKIFD